MSSEAVVPSDLAGDQCKRLAARLGLGFHVDRYGTLVPRGYREESRPATDYEMEMWLAMVPPEWRQEPFEFSFLRFDPRVLDADPPEFDCLLYRGDVTLSAEDFSVLRGRPDFVPSSDPSEVRRGMFGRLGDGRPARVWVSRLVPKGYFHEAALELWRPPPGPRVLAPAPPEHLGWLLRPLLR